SLVLFCPESPRWLVSKGRDAEALRTLAYYHADGDEQDPLIQHEFREIKAAIEFDRSVAANVGWRSLIVTRGNLKRMRIIVALAFFSTWSENGLISYYLNEVFTQIGITGSSTQLLINGVLQIWNLFWAILAAFMVDRLGRRFLFLSSVALMTLFYTAQAVCFAEYAKHGVAPAGHAVVGFVFLFFAAYDIAFTPLIISYTIEILPFSLRAKGFIVFSFVISVALTFNQYVNPIALDALGWKYYV
ncbi:general substrate transporter, partial [Pisolithus orientalis]|uniref:general substrate transporter n=1 Tax=Pisolithus orientalis TaxID=936130 RepID=UPI0022243900